MKCSDQTQTICLNAIRQLSLPNTFMQIVDAIYLPLSRHLAEAKKQSPMLISINGAQGTGKSTLTTFLQLIIEQEYNLRVAVLSLDDFYLTREQRIQLAASIHPLLKTRGVPGTHDLDLLEQVIVTLMQGKSCRIPRFNKAYDDREKNWHDIDHGVDIILFEGWCNNSPYQSEQELITPINSLEENEDSERIWRSYANQKLIEYHKRVYDLADLCLMLQAPDFEHVFSWRRLQEQKLRKNLNKDKANMTLSDTELTRFIMHYERISRHTLRILPRQADILLAIDKQHKISGIEIK